MTRKDYILIADAIKAARSNIDENIAHYSERDQQMIGTWKTANAIVDALAADNPRFDRARFLKACGL